MDTVQQLRNRIRNLESSLRRPGAAEISTGWPPLDALLPDSGLRPGSLVEWLAASPGSGASLLAWKTALQAAQAGGAIVVLDGHGQVYPPALAAWGVDLTRVVFVRPQNAQDASWAWEQALRCPGVAAVWGWVERLDARLFRRWQLAAEVGGCIGLLLRPASVQSQPTWADVRWRVEPRPATTGRRMRVELLRCHGGGTGYADLVLDEWTGQLCDSKLEQQAAEANGAEENPSTNGMAESGMAERGMVESGMAERGMVESGMVESGMAERGMVESGMVESGMVERGMAERGMAERDLKIVSIAAGTATIEAAPAETVLASGMLGVRRSSQDMPCPRCTAADDGEQEPRHVTYPRPLAAQLARATARSRSAGTSPLRHRAV